MTAETVTLDQLEILATNPPILPGDDRRRVLEGHDAKGLFTEAVESEEQVHRYFEYIRAHGLFIVKLYYGYDLIAASYLGGGQ